MGYALNNPNRNRDVSNQLGKSNLVFAIVLLSLIMFFYKKSNAQAPDWQWAKSISGMGSDVGFAVANDPITGDVYSTGVFEGTRDFDPGPGVFNLTSEDSLDIFVSKLDAAGNFVWAKSMGGPAGADYSEAIAVDPTGSGNVYISGTFYIECDFDPGPGEFNLYAAGSWDIFICKLDYSGNLVWAKAMGGQDGESSDCIAIDPLNGDVYTAGHFSATADFDPGVGTFNLTPAGSLDIFISKLDSLGNFVWAVAMGGPSVDIGWSIALDNTGRGRVCTTGYFWGTADFDPGAGTSNLTSAGHADVFISNLDKDGNFQWAKSIGGPAFDWGAAIAIGQSSGNVYTTGHYTGTTDFDPGLGTFNLTAAGSIDIFISKLDNSGNFVWAKTIGGTEQDSGESLIVDDFEHVCTTGTFTGTVDFNPGPDTLSLTSAGYSDIFIVKLDNSGNFVWAQSAGGTGWDWPNSIASDYVGNLSVVGSFESTHISFGATTLTNADTIVYYTEGGDPYYFTDIFIAKLNGCIHVVTSTSDNGDGSLRDIISCAASGATITFALPMMSQITLTTGEIVINKNLTLAGTGIYDLTISGNNASRIFQLLSGKNFTIKDLALKNATASINGGAIYVKGNLTLENILLQNNFENGMPKGMTLINPGNLTIVENVDIQN